MSPSPTRLALAPRPLHDLARVGRAAAWVDLRVIALLGAVVLACHVTGGHVADPRALVVPLAALGVGALGAAFAGVDAVGYTRTPGYPARFACVVAAMMAVDAAVGLALGADVSRVPANWAVLIGSASAVNLLVLRVPLLSARRWLSDSSVARFHPVALLIVVALQVAQAWVSVLGASLAVALAQLTARRVAILGVTHLLARRSYGAAAAQMLRRHETVEYLAIRAVASPEGAVEETDALDQTVVGALLLKLPIFAGEPMTAGRKSLTRVGDKVVFVEQMLAFSSPTMVVARACALGHTAFLQTMLSLDGDPAAKNPRLRDRAHCKSQVRLALEDRWDDYQASGS